MATTSSSKQGNKIYCGKRMNALRVSPQGLMEAVVGSASDVTSSPTGKCERSSLPCFDPPIRDFLSLQIHLLRPGQAQHLWKNSPATSTGPLNLNHLCSLYDPVFLQWWIFSKPQPSPHMRMEPSLFKKKKLKVFLRVYILSMLVQQPGTSGIELEAKTRKKDFSQSIFVHHADNRVKKSVSSCSCSTVKPDLIPQSEI